MRSFRRVTLRVAPALASVASVLLFATCDFDKISGTPAVLTAADINRLFSITPTDTAMILGNSQQFSITPGAGVNLEGTTTRWSSSSATVLGVDTTGFAQALSIGTATITARVIAPELDTGYAKTHALRVRYKGIDACSNPPTRCSPLALDSIAGLNLSRAFSFYGTNINDVIQQPALTGVTITTRDSGATTNTVASVTGSSVFARKNGVAYVIGVFENMRDSIRVKVRQVAKTLLLPDYTVQHLNVSRPKPSFTMRDVNDSVMTESPRLRWRSSDTTVFTIDSLTGVLRVKRKYAVGDTARILLTADTIQRISRLLIDQKVARLRIDAGNNQTDTVLVQLPIQPRVTALDSGDTPVAGVTVTFRLAAAGKSASATIADSVQITDASGVATLGSWKLGPKAGTQTVRAVVGTDSSTLFVADAKSLRPAKLAFGVHPRSAAVAATISPAVTVTIRDSLSNETTASDSVTIAIANNPSGATLNGTKKVAAVNGTATFSDLSLTTGGPGFTLTATSGGLTSTISDAFDIYGTATKLGVRRQPVSTSAGAILDTIQINVLDAQNTTVSTATNSVTLAILNNAGAPAGTLSGTTTVAAVNGVATFTGLSINNAGNGYTLQATATGLTAVTTSAFNVNPVGTPTKLAFTTQPPATLVAGATPTIAVAIQDANGATVGSSTASVSIQLVSSVTGAALSGTVTRNAVSGVATFTGVSVNKVGTGYKILAQSSGLADAQSSSFNVTPGAASKLAFIDQPTHTVVSTTMAPAVKVAVQDANDNLVTTQAPTQVTVALSSCSGGPVSGTTSVNTSSGVATFSALALGSTQATGCTLLATSAGLTSSTSAPFNIVATTGAIRLSFGAQPSNATAGNSIPTFTVRAVDQSGAVVTSAAPFVTLTVLSGPGTIFSGASATASSGTATFSSTQITRAGTYKLLATATGFKVDSSSAFTISAAALSKLGFVQQPATITAGVPFDPPVAVAFQDTYGNTITTQTSNITLERNFGPFSSNLSGGPTTVAAVNGVATFTGLTLKQASTNYNLFASTLAGASSVSSSFFDVVAGPASTLGFTTHPSSFQTAGDLFSATVQAQDSVGNVLSNFSNQVTVALTGGAAGATLLGTTTVTPASGSASFSGLSVRKAGTNYRLNASASGLATGQSNTFTVSAGNSTKLVWLDQIANTVQRAGLDNGAASLPRVAVTDQYSNITSTFFSIQVAIGTNPGGMGMLQNGNAVSSIFYSTGGDGIIELTGLSLSGSGNGVTLLASSSSLTSATSNAFNVAAFGSAAKLAFKQQPTTGTYAVALTPAVEVRIEDDFGNTVTNATNQVTLAKSADPSAGAATLTGGGATAAVAGVATFSGLYLDRPNSGSTSLSGYSLQATATGLTPVTSNTFSISAPGNLAVASNIADMTRVGSRVYWIENGATASLKSINVTGGAVTTHATTGNAARIATDGTNIFWIESGSGVGTGSVRRMDIASGTVTNLATGLAQIRTDANTFATDGSFVYFNATNSAGVTASIRRVPAYPSTPPATPTDIYSATAPNNTGLTFYFTVAGSSVYFYDPQSGAVRRMGLAGGTPDNLTPNLFTTIQRLVLSGTTLYISSGSDIRTIANADTRLTTVTPSIPVAGLGFLYNMIVEGNNMYVKDNSTVRRYDITTFGGTAVSTNLATNGAFSYQTLLLDSTNLFYSNNGSGIGKIPK